MRAGVWVFVMDSVGLNSDSQGVVWFRVMRLYKRELEMHFLKV